MSAVRSSHALRFVDTHCHLFWDSFREDLPAVIARARAAGVDRMLIPATDFATFRDAARIAAHFDGVYLAVGIHPHDAGKVDAHFIDELRVLARHPRVVAIGEIGLDYYYDFCTPAVQQRVLRAQIAVAREQGLPVILHNRESDEDLLALMREQQDGGLRGQFHCFSSGADYARRVLDAGFHISFTGNVTFKKSTLDPVLSLVPDDRLLIETDTPFMTPVPYRGKRNEPSYIPMIAQRFAAARHQSVAHIADITTRNAERLFSLPRRTDRTES
ncbi:MAG: TatD family hydrolase [Bacteroidota bacterium]|nr:TatD family hydrolase [Bacteroidota bacterium]